jgi:hypothetical protein
LTKVLSCGITLLFIVSLAACGHDNDNRLASNNAPAGNQVAAQSTGPTADEGSLQADPNPVPAGEGTGITRIIWKTNGKFEVVKVYVSENGRPETLFAQSPDGSVEAPWIVAGSTYEFRLYGEQGGDRKLINKVQVTRNKE